MNLDYYEITEEEIIKLKSYLTFVGNIKTKIEYIMKSIHYINPDAVIDYIEFYTDTTIEVNIIEDYRRDEDSIKSILIPCYAIKNQQSFIDWLEKEKIKRQKENEAYKIKLEQKQIEQEKQIYQILKEKYGNTNG